MQHGPVDDPSSRPPSPADESAGRGRRPRWAIGVGIGVAVVLAVVAVVVATRDGGSDADPPAAGAPSGASAETIGAAPTDEPVETAAAVEEVHDIDPNAAWRVAGPDGTWLDVPAGSVDGPADVDIAPMTELPGPVGDALSQVGPVVDVELTGAGLVGPARLTLPITDASAFDPVIGPDGAPIDAEPAIVIAHWNGTAWEALDTTVDERTMTATATTTSLSPFGIFRIVGNFVRDLAESFVEELTGGILTFVPQPECDGTDLSATWATDPADSPMSWCAAAADDGSTVVQVVNRRRYAIVVSAPQGTVTGSTTDLAAQLSGLMALPNTVVLAPGDVADVVFPPGTAEPEVTAEYDGMAQTLTTFLVSAEILAAIATKMPFSGRKTAKEFLGLLDIVGCITSLGIDVAAAVTHPASTIVKLVSSCFSKAAGLIGRLLASTVAVIAGVVGYFISSGAALFDLIIGGATGVLAGPGAGTAPASGVPIPAGFAGTWSGTITSSDTSVSPFDVAITFDAAQATLDVGHGNCTGTLVATSAGETSVTMAGTWAPGDGCVVGGTWELQVAGDVVHYRWLDPGGARVDAGDLHRGTDVAAASGSWPDADQEGPPALWVWFGASFVVPDWVSCSARYCIAGMGDEVHLYELDGLLDLGWLSLSEPDPTAAFVEAGIPATEVGAFMTAGIP